jgi:sugar/nucleoside kinase (ribokinase family)
MTITVIGHFTIDEIHGLAKTGDTKAPEVAAGGIFYSLATLSALMSRNDVIHPVFGVSEREYDSFVKSLEDFPNINPEGIYKFKGETNRVNIFHASGNDPRIVCSESIAEPIPFSRIKPCLDADGILINMVSGSDITLDTLDKIRMAVRENRTPIHFDFHSLTLGIDKEYKRFRRPLTEWRRWCFMVNSIQLSEEEAMGLTAERFDESTLVNHLMPLMVNALLITRGERGVSAIIQNNKKLTRHEIGGSVQGTAIDSTGCGDVFGAAFLYHSLKEKDYIRAAEFANRAAAFKSTFSGTAGIRSLSTNVKEGLPAL